MDKIRGVLLGALLLLLGGCGQILVAAPPQAPPSPAVAATPLSSTPETVTQTGNRQPAAPLVPREDRPATVRLTMQPPPPPPAKPEPPPQPSSPPAATAAARPSSASPPSASRPQATYPKARRPTPPQPPPPAELKPLPIPQLSLNFEPPASNNPKVIPDEEAIKEAEAASLALDQTIGSGQLEVAYFGTGYPRDMVFLQIVNRGNRKMTVRLVPGMILNPAAGQQVQPLLVTQDVEVTLQPGERWAGTLESYCMDSRLPAPAYQEPVNYRFTTRTRDGGPEAVRAQRAAQKIAGKSPYAYAITQIAIWKALKQPVEEKHLRSVLGSAADNRRVRREVMREVDRVLESL